MKISEIRTSSFRNLKTLVLTPGSGINLILGENGAGKTSFLEALSILGNLRSFRTPKIRNVAFHGEKSFHVFGKIKSSYGLFSLRQIVNIGPPIQRQLFIDENESGIDRYLQVFPVFAVTPADRDIVIGKPEERRAILDRFVFLQKPGSITALRSYRRALRQRNAALRVQAGDSELSAWEVPLAEAAALVFLNRNTATKVLAKRFSEVYAELSSPTAPSVELSYRGEPWFEPKMSIKKVVEKYQRRYNETRTRDRQMGFTIDGPHRHDLNLKVGGQAVRNILSSGQTKVVAAALRLAMLTQAEKERGERLPVVVDDVDAELDDATLVRFFHRLGNDRQLFLSTTNEALSVTGARSICRIWFQDGACVHQEAENV